MATKSKAFIAARRNANNARIDAANTRGGHSFDSQVAANRSAQKSMTKVRERVARAKVTAAQPRVVAAPPAVQPAAVKAGVAKKAAPSAMARPATRRKVTAAPKKAAPLAAPVPNMSSEIMSREVPAPKMVDKVYGLKRTTPVRKSGWNWSS